MSDSELSIINDPEQEARAAKYRMALEGQGMEDVSEGGGWGDMDEVDDDKVAQILAQKKIDDALADEFERRDAMDFIQELDPDNPSYIQDEPEPVAPVRVKGEGGPMAQLRALRQKLQEEYRKEKGSPEFNFEMPIAKMPAYGFGPQEVGMQTGADFADMGTGMDFNFEERGMMAKPTTRTVGLEFHGQHAHSGTQTLHAAIGRSQTQYFALDPKGPPDPGADAAVQYEAPTLRVARSLSRGGGGPGGGGYGTGIYEYTCNTLDSLSFVITGGTYQSVDTNARYNLMFNFVATGAYTQLTNMYQQYRIVGVKVDLCLASIHPAALKYETTYAILPHHTPILAIVMQNEGPGYFTGRQLVGNTNAKTMGQKGVKVQQVDFQSPQTLTLRGKVPAQQWNWYDSDVVITSQLGNNKYCPWLQYSGRVYSVPYAVDTTFQYSVNTELKIQWRGLRFK